MRVGPYYIDEAGFFLIIVFLFYCLVVLAIWYYNLPKEPKPAEALIASPLSWWKKALDWGGEVCWKAITLVGVGVWQLVSLPWRLLVWSWRGVVFCLRWCWQALKKPQEVPEQPFQPGQLDPNYRQLTMVNPDSLALTTMATASAEPTTPDPTTAPVAEAQGPLAEAGPATEIPAAQLASSEPVGQEAYPAAAARGWTESKKEAAYPVGQPYQLPKAQWPAPAPVQPKPVVISYSNRYVVPSVFITSEVLMQIYKEVMAYPQKETVWGIYGLRHKGSDEVWVCGVLLVPEKNQRQHGTAQFGGAAYAYQIRWLELNFAEMQKDREDLRDWVLEYLFTGHSHHGLGLQRYSPVDEDSIKEAVGQDGMTIAIGPLANIERSDQAEIKKGWDRGTLTIEKAGKLTLRFYFLSQQMWQAGVRSPILITPTVTEKTLAVPPLAWIYTSPQSYRSWIEILGKLGYTVDVKIVRLGELPLKIRFVLTREGRPGQVFVTTPYNFPLAAPQVDYLGPNGRRASWVWSDFQGGDIQSLMRNIERQRSFLQSLTSYGCETEVKWTLRGLQYRIFKESWSGEIRVILDPDWPELPPVVLFVNEGGVAVDWAWPQYQRGNILRLIQTMESYCQPVEETDGSVSN